MKTVQRRDRRQQKCVKMPPKIISIMLSGQNDTLFFQNDRRRSRHGLRGLRHGRKLTRKRRKRRPAGSVRKRTPPRYQ